MQNDLKYTVRSREIVDLAAAMKTASLTLSPYFQRNLVRRDSHRRDFIETILKGYPFTQIFLARGPIDLERMTASQAVVDGQQRFNAIRDFINGSLDVGGRFFSDLSTTEKENFLKYEVAVIDFDLNAGDERLKDVFHRLNRTYYSLSAIEKLASEYSASEFLLVARALAGEILRSEPEVGELEDIESEDGSFETLAGNMFSRDPGIDDETWNWVVERAEGGFASMIRDRGIFTSFEFDRKVPLMFSLNIICSYLTGYYNRNDRVRRLLEEKAVEFNEKEQILDEMNQTAAFIDGMGFTAGSVWWNKANFFSLVVELARSPQLREQDAARTGQALTQFGADLPSDFALAAREAVNGKAQRDLRGRAVRTLLEQSHRDDGTPIA